MRQLRQMLRLHRDGVSAREIGRLLGVARSTVQENLGHSAGLSPRQQDQTDRLVDEALALTETVGIRTRRADAHVSLPAAASVPGPG